MANKRNRSEKQEFLHSSGENNAEKRQRKKEKNTTREKLLPPWYAVRQLSP